MRYETQTCSQEKRIALEEVFMLTIKPTNNRNNKATIKKTIKKIKPQTIPPYIS